MTLILILCVAQAGIFAKPVAKPQSKPSAKQPVVSAPETKKIEISSAPVEPATPFDTALKETKSAEPVIRRHGAEQFGVLRDPNAVPYLVELLNDPTAYVRAAAADSIGLLRGSGDKDRDRAITKLCELLAKDLDETVRHTIAISLSYIGDRKTEDCLIKAMNDKSASVKYAAIRTIGTLKFLKAENELIELLESKDLHTKRAVIEALGNLQSKNSVSAILKYADDEDKYIRLGVARALGEIGDQSVVPALKTKLNDPEDSVKIETALALAKLRDNSGLETAMALVKSGDIALKQQSLNIIAMIGDEKSLKILDELYEAEQEPNLKSFIDFSRQSIKSRLQINK